MYTPTHFRQEDIAEIKRFVRENSFATLISTSNARPVATHIPLELSEDGSKLYGHIAKANPQWKTFSENEVLAVFSGPHAYISSSWYDHENVPTWNYIAVHVYGSIRILDEREAYDSLKHLINKYEQKSEHPAKIENLSKEYLRAQIRALVAFEININTFEASFKLSQNRDAKNHRYIIDQLEKKNDFQAQEIASKMKKYNPHQEQ